jgi:hypothetical protein
MRSWRRSTFQTVRVERGKGAPSARAAAARGK